jgi:hypothetical protein
MNSNYSILLKFNFLGTSYGNLQMQIRTLFSSSGIGIDNFKLSREQHASRYAPSLGKYFL